MQCKATYLNMDSTILLDLIDRAEDSTIQLKQNITSPAQLTAECAAFSNAKGGHIIIGVANDKSITGLTDKDIDRLNQMVSNISEQHIKPPIAPLTEVCKVDDKKLMVIHVEEDLSKPYATNEGMYWTKKGADKRKLSQEELQRLFQSSNRLYADEQLVHESKIKDLDRVFFTEWYEKNYEEALEESELNLSDIIRNLRLGNGENLNLAGLLLFGKKPNLFKPTFLVKGVSFFGNDPAGSEYRDSEDIRGNLMTQYKGTVSFILRNLHKKQNGKGFNTEGEPEIPKIVFEELVVNALLHRNYYINAPVLVFIFDNRIEITSPGKLPNSLTIDNIRSGVSVIRNPILTSFGSKILPYRGVGTGVRRSIKNYSDIEFVNDEDADRFTVIINRPNH